MSGLKLGPVLADKICLLGSYAGKYQLSSPRFGEDGDLF